jgi:predicted O-methyltransferase YrrM
MPSNDQWTAVDEYIADLFHPDDSALDEALDRSRAAGLPDIQVSAAHGQLLYLLARAVGARRILEVGTLGGYSTICLARGLQPGGSLVTLELEAAHAEVARENLRRAGLAERVEVRVGPALDEMERMVSEGVDAFDLIFIDADKGGYPHYLERALLLSREGTLLIADNVIRRGEVLDATSEDETVRGIRLFNERLAADARISATAIQTVGSKGYDGFAIGVVVAA